jgi:hypothetical protein
MRSGTGFEHRLTLAAPVLTAVALLVLALASFSSSAAGDSAPATTSALLPAPPGATKAQTANLYVLAGNPAPTRIHAFTAAATGRLTITSPEGIAAPTSASGICTQDNPNQVSCTPGSILAIVGDLQAGADVVTADPALTVRIGTSLAGPDSPMIGGGGRDLIVGGAEDDLIEGGRGPDTLRGNGGTDVIRGAGGDDKLNGGGSPDALYGGNGADKLNGAGGRDLCVGGPARDRGRSCSVSKTIP